MKNSKRVTSLECMTYIAVCNVKFKCWQVLGGFMSTLRKDRLSR